MRIANPPDLISVEVTELIGPIDHKVLPRLNLCQPCTGSGMLHISYGRWERCTACEGSGMV